MENSCLQENALVNKLRRKYKEEGQIKKNGCMFGK